MKATDVLSALQAEADPEKAKFLSGFFKTGEGQYGHGDVFLGLTVPVTRGIVKNYRDLPLPEVKKLLYSDYHEARLAAALILVEQYRKAKSAEMQKQIFDLYLAHTGRINNWDLVDCSAEHIVGPYLKDKDKSILTRLAQSDSLWERRIAMLSTFHYIKAGLAAETFRLAEILLQDREDLIHKAVGWMLREVGKRCSKEALTEFLDTHTLPRTALRYAIEHFPEGERKMYLARK